MTRAERFMAEAIELSLRNVRDGAGGPFGALVVREDLVIARGVNQVVATHDPTAHAEIVAIRAACRALGRFQLDGCEIYASCEPCPMCLAAIYWARPASLFFAASQHDAAAVGFDDSFIYAELAKPLAGRELCVRQLMREQARPAFDEWSRSPLKTCY
jgi:tRNA(Arg) A34 adenosine deaminase TadA